MLRQSFYPNKIKPSSGKWSFRNYLYWNCFMPAIFCNPESHFPFIFVLVQPSKKNSISIFHAIFKVHIENKCEPSLE